MMFVDKSTIMIEISQELIAGQRQMFGAIRFFQTLKAQGRFEIWRKFQRFKSTQIII